MRVWQFNLSYGVDNILSLRLKPFICDYLARVDLICQVRELNVLYRLICFSTELIIRLNSKSRLLGCSWVAILGRLHQQKLVFVVLDVTVFIDVGLLAYES